MPDDHSEVEPPLPIPNRTVKRFSADDSEHSLVKVGHCQAVTASETPRGTLGAWLFFASMKSRARLVCLGQKIAVRRSIYFKSKVQPAENSSPRMPRTLAASENEPQRTPAEGMISGAIPVELNGIASWWVPL